LIPIGAKMAKIEMAENEEYFKIISSIGLAVFRIKINKKSFLEKSIQLK
jgi:hypothetical protein